MFFVFQCKDTCTYDEVVTVDLSEVSACVSGPKSCKEKICLSQGKANIWNSNSWNPNLSKIQNFVSSIFRPNCLETTVIDCLKSILAQFSDTYCSPLNRKHKMSGFQIFANLYINFTQPDIGVVKIQTFWGLSNIFAIMRWTIGFSLIILGPRYRAVPWQKSGRGRKKLCSF